MSEQSICKCNVGGIPETKCKYCSGMIPSDIPDNTFDDKVASPTVLLYEDEIEATIDEEDTLFEEI